jgi:hypothetical protein
MLDYTDIPSKIEDAQNALDSLYNLIHSQYDGVFKGKDADNYQKMLQNIKNADEYLNEVNEINNRLSDIFEENLDRL